MATAADQRALEAENARLRAVLDRVRELVDDPRVVRVIERADRDR